MDPAIVGIIGCGTISEAYFNAAEIGVSVPLVYPLLAYLLVRMLWIGFRGHGLDGTAGEGLRPSAPVWMLTVNLVPRPS